MIVHPTVLAYDLDARRYDLRRHPLWSVLSLRAPRAGVGSRAAAGDVIARTDTRGPLAPGAGRVHA